MLTLSVKLKFAKFRRHSKQDIIGNQQYLALEAGTLTITICI